MLGENDGPSMIAYAADGAQYGLGFFVPFIPVLFAMAYVCQEMCMRVGAVTHRGYGELVLQRYGRGVGVVRRRRPDRSPTSSRSSPSSSRSAWGSPISTWAPAWPSHSGSCSCVFTLSGGRYWRWERIVLGMALFNGLFLAAAILVKPHVGALVSMRSDFTPFPSAASTRCCCWSPRRSARRSRPG